MTNVGDIPSGLPGLGPLAGAAAVTRGVRRRLAALGHATVVEFVLANGRRADVFAVDAAGLLTIVEVKSSVVDFKTDSKWPNYEGFCDYFYFAVDEAFPLEVLPEDRGIIVADAYDGLVAREAERLSLAPARRKALLIRFAHAAATRLTRLEDPGGAWAGW